MPVLEASVPLLADQVEPLLLDFLCRGEEHLADEVGTSAFLVLDSRTAAAGWLYRRARLRAPRSEGDRPELAARAPRPCPQPLPCADAGRARAVWGYRTSGGSR